MISDINFIEQEKKLHEEIVLMETPNKSPPDQSNAKVGAKSEKSHSSSEPTQNITPGNVNIPSLQKLPVDQSNKEMESKTELRSISDTIEKNDQIKYSPANLICRKPEMKTEQSHSIHETSQRNVSAEVVNKKLPKLNTILLNQIANHSSHFTGSFGRFI